MEFESFEDCTGRGKGWTAETCTCIDTICIDCICMGSQDVDITISCGIYDFTKWMLYCN